MDATKHDPTDTYELEQTAEIEEVEFGTDTSEVMPAEEAAMNIDTDVARDASLELEETELELKLEDEIKQLDVELIADEQKHKNRQSTSEKAKASQGRQSTSEKAKESEVLKAKALDPLRLRGKKYRGVVGLIDRSLTYAPEAALELVKQTSTSGFDSAVELHAKLKTEGVRGTLVLPHGNGKTRRVAIADDATIEKIAAGTIDFDVLLAMPSQMPKLAKHAKFLGPKGLMPSPKSGTVTDNPEAAIAEINGGRIEYRADKTGVVHMSIGKASFETQKLLENYQAVEQVLLASKIQTISLASTMGPGVKVALS